MESHLHYTGKLVKKREYHAMCHVSTFFKQDVSNLKKELLCNSQKCFCVIVWPRYIVHIVIYTPIYFIICLQALVWAVYLL